MEIFYRGLRVNKEGFTQLGRWLPKVELSDLMTAVSMLRKLPPPTSPESLQQYREVSAVICEIWGRRALTPAKMRDPVVPEKNGLEWRDVTMCGEGVTVLEVLLSDR